MKLTRIFIARITNAVSYNSFNQSYDDFTKYIICLMDKNLKFKFIGNDISHKKHVVRPYWDIILTNYWKHMKECEKLFREFKGDLSKRNKLRLNLQKSRNIFDRELRSKERLFYKNKLQSLEYLSKGNQKEFWDRINNLGPGKKRNNVIPMSSIIIVYHVNLT